MHTEYFRGLLKAGNTEKSAGKYRRDNGGFMGVSGEPEGPRDFRGDSIDFKGA